MARGIPRHLLELLLSFGNRQFSRTRAIPPDRKSLADRFLRTDSGHRDPHRILPARFLTKVHPRHTALVVTPHALGDLALQDRQVFAHELIPMGLGMRQCALATAVGVEVERLDHAHLVAANIDTPIVVVAVDAIHGIGVGGASWHGCSEESRRLSNSIDLRVAHFHVLEIAAGEVHMLPAQAIGLNRGARASEHRDVGPVTPVEIQAVPLAVAELTSTEPTLLELRLREGAVGEHTSRDRNALEIACGEGAARELASSPAGLLERARSKAGAGEDGGGELGEVQVQAGVGIAVGHASKTCGGTTGAFAPEVVVLDDQLGGHGLWLMGGRRSVRFGSQ